MRCGDEADFVGNLRASDAGVLAPLVRHGQVPLTVEMRTCDCGECRGNMNGV